MLKGAEPAPIHLPPGVTKTAEGTFLLFPLRPRDILIVFVVKELDEDAMLKQLQAELAM